MDHSGVSPAFQFRSCFYCETGDIIKKWLIQSVAFLPKIYFHQHTLLEFAHSLIEKSKTECQVTAFMGFLGDKI